MLAGPGVLIAADEHVLVQTETHAENLVAMGAPRNLVEAGKLALLYGVDYARSRTGVATSRIRYWMNKLEWGGPVGRGGARNWVFTEEAHGLVEAMLWQLLENNPQNTPHSFCVQLQLLGITDITPHWVVRTLSRWHYSRKKVAHIQKRKFTLLNMCRYVDHVLAIPRYDPAKLKFLDESRFETRRVRRRYGYSPVGQPIARVATDDYRESFTFTLVSTSYICNT